MNVYTICPSTETEFVIAAVRPADKDVSKTLGRETAEGVKGVSRTDGYEILITFKDGMRFANLRPDRSEPSKYEKDKKVAIEHLEYINSNGKSMSTSKSIEKVYNGFSTYSIYRSELIGNNLGVSLIIDDANKVITTVYFINAPKDAVGKHFKTIKDWLNLQEKFLDFYTSCVTKKLNEIRSEQK